MVIQLKRILPDTALSQFRVRDMRPEEVITACCDSVNEYNNARRTAQTVASSFERSDGLKYKIESNGAKNTITVSLVKTTPTDVPPEPMV